LNTTQGATSYNWNFGDASALGSTNTSVLTNPNHTYSIVGSYGVFLVATSNKGCKDTAQLVVEVTPDFVLYIPNTFTPDGNGLNDFFLPMGVGIDENNYRMEVYDRWGERVFTSNNFSKGWDGSIKGNKIGEQAVYVYKIIVYDLQGNKHPFVGHITLLNNN
jgi:gliding motility-associated-like protein